MADIFGADREAVVAREIGKTYEEVVRASLGELAARFSANPARGEITLVVAGTGRERSVQERGGQDSAGQAASADTMTAAALTVEMLCDAGLSLKQASAIMARLGGRSRREVYQAALARRTRQDDNPDD
jgi:16S rRNA (cytidine1402-2'-O)-methyltransferase